MTYYTNKKTGTRFKNRVPKDSKLTYDIKIKTFYMYLHT